MHQVRLHGFGRKVESFFGGKPGGGDKEGGNPIVTSDTRALLASAVAHKCTLKAICPFVNRDAVLLDSGLSFPHGRYR